MQNTAINYNQFLSDKKKILSISVNIIQQIYVPLHTILHKSALSKVDRARPEVYGT